MLDATPQVTAPATGDRHSWPRQENAMHPRLLLPFLVTLALGVGEARAVTSAIPVVGKKLQAKTLRPDRRKFTFVVKDRSVVVSHDPATEGVAFLVRGSTEQTPLIILDPALWHGVGTPPGHKGYRYVDELGTRGGIVKALYKRGELVLKGKGPNWPWSPTAVDQRVWVQVRVGGQWYCAMFGGSFEKNRANDLLAKNAPAPSACPTPVCGNGGSTWAAIQQRIFADSGCADALCHGSATPTGGLDLRPAAAYANLVNVPSTTGVVDGQLLDRIEPGDQDMSFLYLKLAAKTLPAQYPSVPGSPMPSGLPAVSPDVLAALRLWIRAGASETSVVDGTAPLLDACLPPPTPQKTPPLTPPAPGTGVQLYAPAWNLPAHSENEVCYATYYDFTDQVPPSAQVACPLDLGGPTRTCFYYYADTLSMDAQSHHSVLSIYTGASDTTDPAWGAWTCKRGAKDGQVCDPKNADCGAGSGCSSAPTRSGGCVGFGPPLAFLTASPIRPVQVPLSTETFPSGVYAVIPLKGIGVWNSHAFNRTDYDTTIEQYFNFLFAGPANQDFRAITIRDEGDIYTMDVPPFATREYCRTHTFDQNTHLLALSSHTHKRGVRFRIWGPPQPTTCSATDPACVPDTGPPMYVSTDYSQPVVLRFDPPLLLSSSNAADRTYEFCALYDNGATDPHKVKRLSTSPIPPTPPGGPCAVSETRCIGGPNHNTLCNGSNAACDSKPGRSDGACDACPLRGGLTTEDEMLIPIATYYIAP